MSDTNNQWTSLWHNANLATMTTGGEPYGLMANAAIGVSEGKIAWIGDSGDIPSSVLSNCRNILDCEGRLVTPGLIDCHTHLVYAGHRAKEFELRLNGASYEEISRAGGGIISTVNATRAASHEDLFTQSNLRLQGLMREGVTTVEIKSGYGLDLDNEMKMLRVARRLGEDLPVTITTSFLGAHSTPPEFSNRPEEYISLVCDSILPAVAAEHLVDAVDAFCEGIAFSPQQVARVFDAAAGLELPIKLHAEQLSDLKGAVMAARRGALSVDHIEYLAVEDVPELASNSTAAVLLPGAFYCLRETRVPPVEALRRHGVPMAIASDSNPGSSPVGSLLLMLNMACTLFHLTPEEALAGVTRSAARALGKQKSLGTLETGKQADMVLWDAVDPAELSYRIGGNPCRQVMYQGINR